MEEHVFITGSGHTKFGRLSATLEELIVEAAKEAVAEAEICPSDIDAIFLGHFNAGLVRDCFASSLALQLDPALRFVPATRCENACASGAAAIHAGINALRSGRARTVLVVGVEKMTHRTTQEVTYALGCAGYQNDPAEADLSFPQIFGLVAREYAERYGNPLDAMAQIAAKNHRNALSNPLAHMQKAVTVEFCREAGEMNPLIAPPLRLTDCSPITDGAAAIVMSSAGAADSAKRRVRIAADVHVSDFLPMGARDFLAFDGPYRAIAGAYEQAGIVAEDLDFAEVHDCFTVAELLLYEAMGLAPRGRGEAALNEGLVFPEGRVPVNLSGGLKAKGHPVGATGVSMHALGFRQLTGRAGEMQRHGAEWGLIFNMGGAAVANYATILKSDRS